MNDRLHYILGDITYIAILLCLLSLLIYGVKEGLYTTTKNYTFKTDCQSNNGVPVWTKDNVLVCVESKREEDRK